MFNSNEYWLKHLHLSEYLCDIDPCLTIVELLPVAIIVTTHLLNTASKWLNTMFCCFMRVIRSSLTWVQIAMFIILKQLAVLQRLDRFEWHQLPRDRPKLKLWTLDPCLLVLGLEFYLQIRSSCLETCWIYLLEVS